MDGAQPTRERLQDFTGNGPKVVPTFSAAEMTRRLDAIRAHMARAGVDAALFTSYHNINYYSDFLYCAFGRRYGLVVTHDASTSISAGIDGGQPGGAPSAGNVTYTDWQKDNWFHAVRTLTRGAAARHRVRPCHDRHAEPPEGRVPRHGVRRHRRARDAPADDQVGRGDRPYRPDDAHRRSRRRRLRRGDAVGTPEHEVALHSTATMVREIARTWPHAELMDTWTWFQSGLNTDGAHNPVTSAGSSAATSSASTASRWSPATTSRSNARSSPRPRAPSTSASGRSTAGSTTAARNCWCPATAARTSRRS
jgi:creatinase